MFNDSLKMAVRLGLISVARVFSTLADILSGPGALEVSLASGEVWLLPLGKSQSQSWLDGCCLASCISLLFPFHF